MLRKKLNQLLETGKLPAIKPKVTQEQIAASNEMRRLVNERLKLPLSTFLRTKPDFHAKHGMAYKLLKTTPQRLRDSTLCSHDVAFWLRDHKNPTAAAWVLKLAGPEAGQVSRNQLLQWLHAENRRDESQLLYQWTRKWGFRDSDVTKSIMANPTSVEQAREMYKEFKSEKKQAYGNKLLRQLSVVDARTRNLRQPEQFYGFFRTLNKDVVTFQIMLSAMVRSQELRKYLAEVWGLAERQAAANNMKIDDKLRETYERILRLKAKQEEEMPVSNLGGKEQRADKPKKKDPKNQNRHRKFYRQQLDPDPQQKAKLDSAEVKSQP